MAAQDVAASWGEWVWSKCLSYDHWMTMNFAGEEWTTSGRTDEYLPWKELPLSNAISPTIGVLVYLISECAAQSCWLVVLCAQQKG